MASVVGHTRVRIRVTVVVILVASSAAGSVIIAGIVLLPPPRDQTSYASIAVRGATRRPNVQVWQQQDR